MLEIFDKLFQRSPFPKIIAESAIITILFFTAFDEIVDTLSEFIILIWADILLLIFAALIFATLFYILVRYEISNGKEE